jgi:hypothetical protein
LFAYPIAQFSDYAYLSSVIRAVASTGEAAPKERREKLLGATLKQIDRYLNLNKLIPSYRHSVTIACIEVQQCLAAVVSRVMRVSLLKKRAPLLISGQAYTELQANKRKVGDHVPVIREFIRYASSCRASTYSKKQRKLKQMNGRVEFEGEEASEV